MNRIQVIQILVLVTCSMLIAAYSAPAGNLLAAQLDDDWVARPMYISPFAGSPTPIGYSPDKIRTAYNLPASGGAGTTIAIIDAYDTPNILSYFNAFSGNYSLPDNSTGNFIVHKMPGTILTDSDWALETCLDVEWAHAIAPDAKILLVEAASNSRSNLLSAVDYAASQPGVVAVSMSWGDDEFSGETSSIYENHFNKPGITFFAASGDDGSNVIWPAASAKIVSVGGTTLNLNAGGTVISETAWRNSSGGVSSYVARPIFQTNYGLAYLNRAVPDVSYNGDVNTGVAVYNGTWWKVGGTSAGAPQWAAIHALGLSATNNNLYARAKSAYSSYFRDITAGSNYVNSATTDYDLVTGLGSPLTFNFGALTVTPNSGSAGGLLTLSGIGFTAGSSVNITYLNPENSSWVPLVDNYATAAGTFNYFFHAPDLLRSNPAEDNGPQFDSIIFRAQDNNNGRYYNTTVPYTEWRRGLTKVADASATGLYGNNTNLAAITFVQNGQSIIVSGHWFNPFKGTTSLLWDDTLDLGAAAIDETGFFSETVQVPTTSAGQHTITIDDRASVFCVNLTRLPTVANDYVYSWHTTDFQINLTPDYAVDETFYRINGGTIYNVTSNGQPKINSEGSSHTLEYWSTWNVYGTGTKELMHVTVPGIKLDKTTPIASIASISSIVETPEVTLILNANDDVSGVWQMRFSNGQSDWSSWEPYTASQDWTLQSGDGAKTVFVQFMDNAGLTSTYSCIVALQTPEASLSPTASPTTKPAATADLSTSIPTPSNAPLIQPSVTPQVPELNIEIVLTLLAASTLILTLISKKAANKTGALCFCG